MVPLEITGTARLLLGLFTGVLFGILLHKGKVSKYDVIVKQFLLTDFTVLKVMLSAVVVGSAGIYLMASGNLVQFHIKPMLIGGVTIGAVIFGIGMAILGYCPGTCIAAAGHGSLDALVGGVFGGIFGAGLYAHFYLLFKQTVLQWGAKGKITIPQALAVNPWVVIASLGCISTLIFIFIEKYEKRIKIN